MSQLEQRSSLIKRRETEDLLTELSYLTHAEPVGVQLPKGRGPEPPGPSRLACPYSAYSKCNKFFKVNNNPKDRKELAGGQGGGTINDHIPCVGKNLCITHKVYRYIVM